LHQSLHFRLQEHNLCLVLKTCLSIAYLFLHSQEDWPADRYERVALIAEKQEFVFLSQIRDYLTHNASF